MKPRSLHLRRETLAELTSAELGSVVGGQDTIVCANITKYCIPTQGCTGYYPSLNAPCTTD